MAYIVSSANTIAIHAVLTKAGRQKLASGVDTFKITKFALADDEIDYSIEGLGNIISDSPHTYPIFQPILNGNLMMRSKLYTDFNTNVGSRILAQVFITNLLQGSSVNTIVNKAGSRVTYTPSTIGATGTDYYNVEFEFSSGSPFAQITYKDNTGKLITATKAGTHLSLSNVSQFTLYPSGRTEHNNISFRMTVRSTISGGSPGVYSVQMASDVSQVNGGTVS